MPSWDRLPSLVKKLSNWGYERGLLASNSLAAHPVIIGWMTHSFISFEILISHSGGIFPRSKQLTNSCCSLIELLGLRDHSNWGFHLRRYVTQPREKAKVNSALACPGSGPDLSIKQETVWSSGRAWLTQRPPQVLRGKKILGEVFKLCLTCLVTEAVSFSRKLGTYVILVAGLRLLALKTLI